jgi:hypothetical protein
VTHLDIDTGASTLIGVTAGALLATLGGLLAGQFEHHLRRLEREKSAALLFGEILAALRLILRLAQDAHGRGDPFGSITTRILRAAQREPHPRQPIRGNQGSRGCTAAKQRR